MTKDNLPKLFERPGVYFFKNQKGEIIYVGKAINLKKRVGSYFVGVKERKTQKMVSEAASLHQLTVDSEVEALLLEAKYIKNYQPKYNVDRKDDRRYLYLGISEEPIPKVGLIRQPEINGQIKYWFGPFPSAQSIREVLRLVRRIFPFRSCNKLPAKTCFYYDLKLCPGVCCRPDNLIPYRNSLKNIRLLFDGRFKFLKKRLYQEMKVYSQKLDFEKADLLKKQILTLEELWLSPVKKADRQLINRQTNWLRKLILKYQRLDIFLLQRMEAYDIANLGRNLAAGAMVVFEQAEPQKSQYRLFKIRTATPDDAGAMAEVIERRLRHPDWLLPQLILVDGGKPQVAAAARVLEKNGLAGQIGLLGLAKKEEIIYSPVFQNGKIRRWHLIKPAATTNGLLLLQQLRDEAHRFSQRYFKKLYSRAVFS